MFETKKSSILLAFDFVTEIHLQREIGDTVTEKYWITHLLFFQHNRTKSITLDQSSRISLIQYDNPLHALRVTV